MQKKKMKKQTHMVYQHHSNSSSTSSASKLHFEALESAQQERKSFVFCYSFPTLFVLLWLFICMYVWVYIFSIGMRSRHVWPSRRLPKTGLEDMPKLHPHEMKGKGIVVPWKRAAELCLSFIFLFVFICFLCSFVLFS